MGRKKENQVDKKFSPQHKRRDAIRRHRKEVLNMPRQLQYSMPSISLVPRSDLVINNADFINSTIVDSVQNYTPLLNPPLDESVPVRPHNDKINSGDDAKPHELTPKDPAKIVNKPTELNPDLPNMPDKFKTKQ